MRLILIASFVVSFLQPVQAEPSPATLERWNIFWTANAGQTIHIDLNSNYIMQVTFPESGATVDPLLVEVGDRKKQNSVVGSWSLNANSTYRQGKHHFVTFAGTGSDRLGFSLDIIDTGSLLVWLQDGGNRQEAAAAVQLAGGQSDIDSKGKQTKYS